MRINLKIQKFSRCVFWAGFLVFCLGIFVPIFVPINAYAQILTGYNNPEDFETEPQSEQKHEPVTTQAEPIQPLLPPSQKTAQLTKAPEVQQHSTGVRRLTGYEAMEQVAPAQVVSSSPKQKKDSSGAELSDDPVDLQADTMTHDEESQTVTASGNVFLTQSGRILRADEISYNLATDTVIARGHVVLNEPNGDIHYAEEVEFNEKLKNGFIEGLKTYLADGSRFTAQSGERTDGVHTTMHDATYTPCEPCKKNPDKAPVWQIRADEVTHDAEEKSISYKNARFEAFGVPVAYTPYFSHPDGSIERKSGFLSPSVGFKSRLGAFVENSYYWNIAPDKDATVGLTAMTKAAPLLTGQWRQRWRNSGLELEGGITYSDRVENKAGIERAQDEELRGHVFAEGLWDINDKWRSGVNVEWASDDQYMRQYDFSNEDVLESQVYAERFSGRDYASARLIAFQDVRVLERQEDQPEVLPEVVVNFLGEPDSVPLIGGRWGARGSLLGLRRGGDDQDMNRLAFKGSWFRRFVSDFGLLTTAEASGRADFYNTRDRDVATPGSGQSNSTTESRFVPNLHIKSSYPLTKAYDKMQALIEPVVALTVSPNIDVNNDIPNEDSQDVQIDASNLFEANRFPGLDRVEDQSRVTYGARAGLYGYEGSHGDIFLGQSYRFENDDNPFPEGSGLSEQESDLVGQVSLSYQNQYSLNYRFQLESQDLSSRRHEVDSYIDWDRFRLSNRYLFAKALEGTDIDDSREQLRSTAYYYLTDEWRTHFGGTQDLGDDPGLRGAYLGLDYFGQCVSWSLTGYRRLTADSSGDSSTEVLFRIGLKNLGEFEPSGLRQKVSTE